MNSSPLELESGLGIELSTSLQHQLQDIAVAARANGWVAYVKTMPGKSDRCMDADNKPMAGCQECARTVHSFTSPDLVTWTRQEQVLAGASVPDIDSAVRSFAKGGEAKRWCAKHGPCDE